LRHRHELRTGRTSSLALEVLGYSSSGEVINYATPGVHSSEHILEQADKIICFSGTLPNRDKDQVVVFNIASKDTCGHSKYLKTTVTGLAGHFPDYACLVLAGNEGGISEMAKEHTSLLVMLGVPFLVVVTKVDISTRQQITETMQGILMLIRSLKDDLIPCILQGDESMDQILKEGYVLLTRCYIAR
jgi:GTPase